MGDWFGCIVHQVVAFNSLSYQFTAFAWCLCKKQLGVEVHVLVLPQELCIPCRFSSMNQVSSSRYYVSIKCLQVIYASVFSLHLVGMFHLLIHNISHNFLAISFSSLLFFQLISDSLLSLTHTSSPSIQCFAGASSSPQYFSGFFLKEKFGRVNSKITPFTL